MVFCLGHRLVTTPAPRHFGDDDYARWGSLGSLSARFFSSFLKVILRPACIGVWCRVTGGAGGCRAGQLGLLKNKKQWGILKF